MRTLQGIPRRIQLWQTQHSVDFRFAANQYFLKKSNDHAARNKQYSHFVIDKRISCSLNREGAQKNIYSCFTKNKGASLGFFISIQLGIMSGRIIYPVNFLRHISCIRVQFSPLGINQSYYLCKQKQAECDFHSACLLFKFKCTYVRCEIHQSGY